MNKRIKDFSKQSKEHAEALFPDHTKFNHGENWHEAYHTKFAELILANADELKRMMNTDPINKPFELNPKFVAKCDEIGRSRRQFQ